MKLTEKEIGFIVDETLQKLNIKKAPFFERRTMDSIPLNEALIRSVPIDKVVKHFISSYNFAYWYNYKPSENPGIIATSTLNNDCEVIFLYVDDEKRMDYCEKIMAKLGWIKSSNDLDLEDYHNLVGSQFERKKDIEATERVLQSRYIYHYCSSNPDILNKIMKKGLCPKMKSWDVFGGNKNNTIKDIRKPENDYLDYSRVYFFFKKPNEGFNADDYFVYKQQNAIDKSYGYTLLRIDTKKLLPNTFFFYDPRQKDAVFTQSNIPPSAIEIVK